MIYVIRELITVKFKITFSTKIVQFTSNIYAQSIFKVIF